MLEEKDGINELHALWDSTIYEYDQDFAQPLSEESWEALGDISKKLREEHPVSSLAQELQVPEKDWAAEGYELATQYVYSIAQNTLPDDDYVDISRAIVHKQLAKGGYRLAETIVDIFKKRDENDDTVVLKFL